MPRGNAYSMTMHILLVENNKLSQPDSLIANLQAQDYQVTVAHTAKTAAQKTEAVWPNVVIFNATNCNVKLSNLQDTINQSNLNIPYVIVGEANNQTIADNTFFSTPGDSDLLTQTITKAIAPQKDRFVRLPDLVIDTRQRQVLRGSQQFHLTPKEFKLLLLLVEYKDRDLSRRAIMKEVWETDYMGDTRTLDVHIRWVREKIEDDPNRPRRLITIRGVGYRLITQTE
jgi:DNA-binding response OmpR family regulator